MAAHWFVFALAIVSAFSQTVPVADNLRRLVAQEDTDGDQKITIHDRTTPIDQSRCKVAQRAGTLTNFYQMSVLLQELKQADDRHAQTIAMDQLHLDEDIVDRTHRFIKDKFWDALTRRIDAEHLDQVVHDSKVTSKSDYHLRPGCGQGCSQIFSGVGNSRATPGTVRLR